MNKSIIVTMTLVIMSIMALSGCAAQAGGAAQAEGAAQMMYTQKQMYPLGEVMEPDNWEGGFQLSPEELEALWDSMFDPETVQIIVDGEAIEAPAPFVNRETGLPMLPVTYIVQALGYPVYTDDQDPLIVTIGRGITFTVGIDSYSYMRMAPVQLHAAPEMHDGVVFVPKHFFGEVMPIAAYIMDGNIIVSSEQLIGGSIEFVD